MILRFPKILSVVMMTFIVSFAFILAPAMCANTCGLTEDPCISTKALTDVEPHKNPETKQYPAEDLPTQEIEQFTHNCFGCHVQVISQNILSDKRIYSPMRLSASLVSDIERAPPISLLRPPRA
ncbi:hypothetical protein DES40_1024 [Litorimonas taeanensis]|uniref:Uncharacterized protein n=1 Tax=Litorimonas taeanensis TaxID=568099 RepID=A0A420WLB2_9PROT|nr:hypothetical protein [Litorimonas taeanensis]RKQ71696.1 hypothetical protein DES40_1024 [Litorimonas taeanensis]